ncbi:MAG: valine--tRNA ligase [Deltaproteobacteria bacterium]|nr:valine--tRNA ligase [Deltaproteobacteria bacterium]
MSIKTLDKTYEPKSVEEKWADAWAEKGLTTADASSKKPAFSMALPPPNITGTLHVGHALNATLQDILARYKRMKGFNVLWLPGIDHAGIATQNVVERELLKEGVSRHALGREEFLKRVWQWKEKSGSAILNQLKRLGASCDWTRLRFTMDEGLSTAVREVFVRLYEEGLIYRGDYVINWCPRCHTALSDLEVQFEETLGKLYYMDYPLEGMAGAVLTVATTRPETMFGDTAVAVNPEDGRYKAFIGKSVNLPLAGRAIPVIADESVSMEFGTGAVKITPAHDFNDFETSKRHGLPALQVMDMDARMNKNAGQFEGFARHEARERILKELGALKLLRKQEDYKLMLGSCYRCSTVVEPMLSKQWFVSTKPLAEPAIKAVEDGRIRFVPKGWENTYFDWMKNIRDWCISRQIWWGHRIPAWHCKDCGAATVSRKDPEECASCKGKNIAQDSDVLDTWFSSALWPFSTLGWPGETTELKLFYPTSTLSTSFDIIFFWVARMIMMGLKFTGQPPFRDVYIHALIRDAEGQKMSKSKGNVIDPLVMMEKYGTDALRFTLAAFAAQGRDIKLSEERIEGYRNFCNKIWNLARFTLMNVGSTLPTPPNPPLARGGVGGVEPAMLSQADKWILARLSAASKEVSDALDAYRFDEASRVLYRFVWHELCDWYVELSKKDLRGGQGEARQAASSSVLVHVLKETMKLIHPFMPFITEEVYSHLPGAKGTLLEASFPLDEPSYQEDALKMDMAMDVIRAVRNIRTEMNIHQAAQIECLCFVKGPSAAGSLVGSSAYIMDMAKVSELKVMEHGERPKDAAMAMAGAPEAGNPIEVYVPLKGHIDIEAELKRLGRESEKLSSEYGAVEARLSSSGFAAKAPVEVVEKERARLAALSEKMGKIALSLERMKSLKGV